MEENEDLIFIDSAGKEVNKCDKFNILLEGDTVDGFNNNVTLKKAIDCESSFKDLLLANLYSTVEFLKSEITEKNNIIKKLIDQNKILVNGSTIKNAVVETSHIKPAVIISKDSEINHPLIDDEWHKANGSRAINNTQRSNWDIPLTNRYTGMIIDHCTEKDDSQDSNPQLNANENLSAMKGKETIKKDTISNNKVYTNKKQINNLPLRNVARPIKERYASYAEKSVHRKLAIISDSITKPIDMVEFNDKLINGSAVKRAYGGATTSRLKHYVKATLNIDTPDTIIIHAGTNNLTKTKQTVEEIASDIFDIVETCQQEGVRNIFISSITCRPQHQSKIDALNRLLREYAPYYKYEYIDNANIQQGRHLRKDLTHLNREGIFLLVSNFLSHLNKPSISLPFADIWE